MGLWLPPEPKVRTPATPQAAVKKKAKQVQPKKFAHLKAGSRVTAPQQVGKDVREESKLTKNVAAGGTIIQMRMFTDSKHIAVGTAISIGSGADQEVRRITAILGLAVNEGKACCSLEIASPLAKAHKEDDIVVTGGQVAEAQSLSSRSSGSASSSKSSTLGVAKSIVAASIQQKRSDANKVAKASPVTSASGTLKITIRAPEVKSRNGGALPELSLLVNAGQHLYELVLHWANRVLQLPPKSMPSGLTALEKKGVCALGADGQPLPLESRIGIIANRLDIKGGCRVLTIVWPSLPKGWGEKAPPGKKSFSNTCGDCNEALVFRKGASDDGQRTFAICPSCDCVKGGFKAKRRDGNN